MPKPFDPREDDSDAQAWPDDDAAADPEGPQAGDLTDQEKEETPTVPCPNCGHDVPDFADRCPYCGDWIVQGGAARPSPGTLIVAIVAVLLILALLFWCV
jgi:DNA-directed RNA polymerase subunit RPC12/RpoP